MVEKNNDHLKEYRITAAVDKETYNAVQNLALETYRTASQVANAFIIKGLLNDEVVLRSTSRNFSLQILAIKSSELKENLRNYDEFYQFKLNLWEICLNLNGKIGNISSHGIGTCGFKDLIDLVNQIKETEPALFKECVPIFKKTLNKNQLEYIL